MQTRNCCGAELDHGSLCGDVDEWGNFIQCWRCKESN